MMVAMREVVKVALIGSGISAQINLFLPRLLPFFCCRRSCKGDVVAVKEEVKVVIMALEISTGSNPFLLLIAVLLLSKLLWWSKGKWYKFQ